MTPSLQFELGWKLLRDLLRYEGDVTVATGSPRGILKASYRVFGFLDEQTWLAMLRDRNDIMYAYDEEELKRLLRRILGDYIPAFQSLSDAVADHYGDELLLIP